MRTASHSDTARPHRDGFHRHGPEAAGSLGHEDDVGFTESHDRLLGKLDSLEHVRRRHLYDGEAARADADGNRVELESHLDGSVAGVDVAARADEVCGYALGGPEAHGHDLPGLRGPRTVLRDEGGHPEDVGRTHLQQRRAGEHGLPGPGTYGEDRSASRSQRLDVPVRGRMQMGDHFLRSAKFSLGGSEVGPAQLHLFEGDGASDQQLFRSLDRCPPLLERGSCRTQIPLSREQLV